MSRINELVARIADDELRDEIRRELRYDAAWQAEEDARNALGETIDMYREDPEWGERYIESAADDYIRAQDNRLRVTDPDRYAEQKYMGLL